MGMGISMVILSFVLMLLPSVLIAQDSRGELRESQQRLEKIRQEKTLLQQELDQLKSRVRDASREADNLARQRRASADALKEMDYQAQVINADVEKTTRELGLTHAKLRQRNTVMHDRLRSIYKRGELHAVRVLLSAENFGDLLSRYKYLHLITLNDRMVITQVKKLARQLDEAEAALELSREQLESLRRDKAEELHQLELLQGKQTRALTQFRERERVTAGRIAQLVKDEAKLTDLIADLDRRRREAETRGSRTSTTSTLTTRDLGALDWPVDGQLVFRFGPERRPNGVMLRNNGIGIAAAAGTQVRAVEAGTVEIAGPLEGYGPSVVIGHGGGSYTLYLRLHAIAVRVGQKVIARQVLGTVGGEATPEGPHLEFQVRTPSTSGSPTPVDPLNWLRARANTR